MSFHGWNEELIRLNKLHDRIGPAMKEIRATENVIQMVLKASFSIVMVPIDSSKSQCLFVTVQAKIKDRK